jgi:hypothetical protein
MNHIIDVLNEEIEAANPNGSTDYKSGFNDGAYTLWRYLFEPTSIPPETRQKVEASIRNQQINGFTVTEIMNHEPDKK